jgi:hypothetical protein
MVGQRCHNDCVTAEEAFAKTCNNPEIFIPDNEAIAWATRHGVLEGATLTEVLQWMQNDGFPEAPLMYDDGSYFSVDWTASSVLQSAISSGPVKIGVAANQIETAWREYGGRRTRSGVGRNQSRVDLTLESDFSRLLGWHLADLSTQFTYRSNEDKIDPLSGWL